MTQEEHQEKDLIMTQEDKELLLKDLCARLPYGVIVDYKENEFETPHWKITTIYPETLDGWIGYDKRVGAGSESGSRPFKIGEVKPYLRPMSSITEEEAKEFDVIGDNLLVNGTSTEIWNTVIDWLNEHYFDHRNLIEKGLALEAPEGMYKTE